MKTLSLLFLLCCTALAAQSPLLKVTFEQKKTFPPEVLEKFASLGPNGLLAADVAHKSVLYYQDKRSCFQAIPTDTIIGGIPVRNSTNSLVCFFKDHSQKRVYKADMVNSPEKAAEEVLGERNNWQLRPDLSNKVILGYKCSAASLMEKSGEVIAWYAPELPFPDGPIYYGMLPGLILEVEQKTTRYTATKIEVLKESPPHDLNYQPKEVITAEEFKAAIFRVNGH